jgi:LytS/YehU family sensor histidine kinase
MKLQHALAESANAQSEADAIYIRRAELERTEIKALQAQLAMG